jgi:hypothetical protein
MTRIIFAIALGAVALVAAIAAQGSPAVVPAVSLSAGPPPAQGVRLAPIGNPTWKPVDFHLFSAPVGTADTGYAEFSATVLALLPPPNHEPHPDLGVGPGAPHSPPYDSELATGIAEAGFHEGVRFNSSEFSNGNGVWLVWMNVPAPGTTGSSPDFASGPIIPNSLFPIHVSELTSHNGKVFDLFPTEFSVPPLDGNLDPPFDVDGHSHVPIFIADNADFGPPGAKLGGSYEYQITMIDRSGNGWRIQAHFAVAP